MTARVPLLDRLCGQAVTLGHEAANATAWLQAAKPWHPNIVNNFASGYFFTGLPENTPLGCRNLSSVTASPSSTNCTLKPSRPFNLNVRPRAGISSNVG
jgi:hypothetical protein